MVKVFISQPMRDLSKEQIMNDWRRAVNNIKEIYKDDDVHIIESFVENEPRTYPPLWFLGRSLQKLSEADVAYFVKGWERNRGCNIEYSACKHYDIDIIKEK